MPVGSPARRRVLALVLVASHASPRTRHSPIRRRSGSPEGAYPPFNFIDQNNELQGFEVDLLKALCEVMKARCSSRPSRVGRHRPGPSITNTTPSCRRSRSRSGARRIAFSRRYYRVPPASGEKDADLKQFGARPSQASGSAPSTAANTRPTSNPYTRERNSGPTGNDEANSIFLTGRLDYVIGDKLPHAIPEHPRGLLPPSRRRRTGGPGLFRLWHRHWSRREDEVLKLQFDRAIAELGRRNHDRIREKYFPSTSSE